MKSFKRKDAPTINNSVAKFANEFNRSATHADRKNDYRRKAKHSKKGEE